VKSDLSSPNQLAYTQSLLISFPASTAITVRARDAILISMLIASTTIHGFSAAKVPCRGMKHRMVRRTMAVVI